MCRGVAAAVMFALLGLLLVLPLHLVQHSPVIKEKVLITYVYSIKGRTT